MMELTPGLKGFAEAEVVFENTAAAVGSGALEVFATPSMIALMEKAALESVQPLLEPGQSTVGTELKVSHLAATPMGMTVRAESELTAVDGRVLSFKVAAWAGEELIGEGEHKRCIVYTERFMAKAAAKRQKS